MNSLIKNYKKNAKNRGVEFSLSNDCFRKITSSNCYYCNALPNNRIQKHKNTGYYIYNGIDRVDSNKGYVEGNVVSCCSNCNYLKGIFEGDNKRLDDIFVDAKRLEMIAAGMSKYLTK